MRFLFIVLFISQSLFASTQVVSDKEAELLIKKYDALYDKRDPKIVSEVFSESFFDEKEEKEQFVKNMKEDKTKSKKLSWKISPSTGDTKHIKVNDDKIFILISTPKGPRINRIYEAD